MAITFPYSYKDGDDNDVTINRIEQNTYTISVSTISGENDIWTWYDKEPENGTKNPATYPMHIMEAVAVLWKILHLNSQENAAKNNNL